MKNTITLTGWDAIDAKYQDESVVLHNYTTAIEPAADDITKELAREIAHHEDPTLIWCEIEVAKPDRESLKEVLQSISDGSFWHASPIVTFDRLTGRWSIMSDLTEYWRAPWVIEVADNPREWAGNLFADQHGDIQYGTALDGCTDEWLMEYATGEYKEN